jgi:YVTN family beta-propeller protein
VGIHYKSSMAIRFLIGLLLVAASLTADSPRPAGKVSRLYVTSSEGDDIHIIDLTSLKSIGHIRVGRRPHGAAASADGRLLFTTIESNHTLLVLDTASGKVLQSIKLTGLPNQCAATPDGAWIAVPIRDSDRVDVVQRSRGRVIKSLPVKTPHNCYSAGQKQILYVTSMASHCVKVLDVRGPEYVGTVPVGGVPRPLAVTGDGQTLYCALSDLHGFVIADIPSRKVIAKIELPPLPAGVKLPVPHTPTHGLELTPDGKELWVTSCATATVYVFDTAVKKIVAKVGVGKGPNWVTFSRDGRYCCVSNVLSDDVSILDVARRSEVARLRVGRGPKRLVAVEFAK